MAKLPVNELTPIETNRSPSEYTPDELAEFERDANQGLSKSAEDNLVPIIYTLQRQSPQVNDGDSRYIQGAKAGDIWLRNAPHPIIKGSEGAIFQPCFFAIDWSEWIPRERGGGFVARHGYNPDHPQDCPVKDAIRQIDPQNPNRQKWIRPNGNEIIQSRNHVGYVLNVMPAMAYVIPFSSTGHTVSRQWMNLMNQKMLPSGQTAPSRAFCYRLTTRQRSNPMGTWYTIDVRDERKCTKDEYDRGTALYRAMQSGDRTVENPVQDTTVEVTGEEDGAL